MNIFSKITYPLLALSFLIASCSNDDTKTIEPEVVNPACQLTSYTNQWFMGEKSSNKALTKFVYDAKGRIIIAPEGSNQISFEYYDDKIIVKYANAAPNTVTDYYTLDANKNITHLVRKAMNSYWGDTEVKDYLVLDFEYDENRQLIVIKEGSNKATFKYLNGNVIEMHDGLNKQNKTYKFSYNLEEDYQTLFLSSLTPIYHLGSLHRIPTPSNNPIGMAVLTSAGYFGKLPKNQIKTIGAYDFSYSKNESKQIIRLIEKNSDEAIDSTEYNFEYFCK
jgi:hypothetical protein